ncbi:MAG: DNA-formamidopyrimidine glycosylase family protein [Pseudomonadota bacterium]
MPEIPDIKLYRDALAARLVGKKLLGMRVGSPFVLRSVAPAPGDLVERKILEVGHMAKQLLLTLEDEHFILIHLMIAGRFRWVKAGAKIPRGSGLAAWDFAHGTLILTEVSKKKRASIHLLKGREALVPFDRGGLDPLSCSLEAFRQRLTEVGHTLKRALTDQRLLAGIGNAYSDEILFAARLSPLQLTRNLSDDEWQRLYRATQRTLKVWIERLAEESGDRFPAKVTAFRPEMAVHGRYGEPCLVCGSPVQRIQYASNEANYCARCQTGGRLLSDRVLARLLKSSWPRSIDELE